MDLPSQQQKPRPKLGPKAQAARDKEDAMIRKFMAEMWPEEYGKKAEESKKSPDVDTLSADTSKSSVAKLPDKSEKPLSWERKTSGTLQSSVPKQKDRDE